MSLFFETFLPLDDDGYDVRIKYRYYAGCRGAREEGLQMEPDEPPSVEIEEVKKEDGTDLLDRLDDDTVKELEEQAFKDYHDRLDPY